jgi:uncharacterized protein (DUF433 family)
MSDVPITLIVKTPDTCGGRARIDGTRLTVWCLMTYWLGGIQDKDLLEEFPDLTQEQLDAAKKYAEENWDEIDRDLEEHKG